MPVVDLPAAWLTRGPLACALLPLAGLARAALGVRAALWRWGWRQPWRAPVPVVVVGNVVAGGAGKTPTVMALVRHLQLRGWHPGVVSRGYGRHDDTEAVVVAGTSPDPAQLGDEPALIAQETGAPLAVGRDRPGAVATLLRQHPEVDIVISDDGMQHWALARDLTIVVFDERDVGNGWLLPAGPLREPWPARLLPLGPLWVLRTAPPHQPPRAHPYPEYRATRALAPDAIGMAGERMPLQTWATAHAPVGALAGIARPEAFFAQLRERGLALAQTLALPDHAPAPVLQAALAQAAATAQAPRIWLCTDKDAVKLRGRPLPPGVSLWRVPLLLSPEPAWVAALDRLLDDWRARRDAL
ncbi:Tetraacyldisaccharide 4'-kinase [Tepidimonas thermarum]|uniref:Tetraacyldisaccharide 4'-kinase n=1 Tax=Tepidimonas thermarum TaxID=335431 RepID=A0A554X0B3_9BURK|nr:tetraacyldisaccharide 4'-kinase [Tepidimonas thermarum]TSE29301.1 Tetraacyldisaccharide 4'-kinase [Tepidimonas thermarum]